MFQLHQTDHPNKLSLYEQLTTGVHHLFQGERDFLANTANLTSLLFHTLPNLNWCGVYLNRNDELVLGPFQGKPACIRIAFGKGVCGTVADTNQSVVVQDVHKFSGHIACDPDSRSEIVIPLIKENQLIGVLDLDSPLTGNFDQQDQKSLESLVDIYLNMTDMPDHLRPNRPLAAEYDREKK